MLGMLALTMVMSADVKPLESGDYTRTLTVDDRERTYLVHVPKREDAAQPWPVVLMFHGGGSDAHAMVEFTGLNEKADEAGFLVVYPNGTGRLQRVLTWNGGNCCGRAMADNVDDVKFVAALLDDLAQVVPVDVNRVCATGMSNGAIMCYRLAAELADRIAAIAPVAGPMGTESCSPSRPVSICHFHGTDDAYAPFQGGVGKRSLTRTNFYSVEHSLAAWVKANGCHPKPEVTELPAQVDDGTSITRTTYSGGQGGAEVVLYTIQGAGHTWPGRPSQLSILGTSTKNISANDAMWEFFRRHPRAN
jgi:polyhydroxybutyrate depolymerase